MSQPRFFGPDPAQMRLRQTLATLVRRIDRATESGIPVELARHLRTSLADLTEQLALGPEPELRACPQCGTLGMRSATICGACWTRLEALASITAS